MDMSPEKEEKDYETGVGVEKEVNLGSSTGDCKEECQDELHDHELDIVGQIVRPTFKSILQVRKQ